METMDHRACGRAPVEGDMCTFFRNFFEQAPDRGQLPPRRDDQAKRGMAVDPGVHWSA